ncbi:UDP-N-acetylglucosamine transporter yea4 [Elsinoe australis]|uniref:UDP-N-acetylglucosamine transporter yea4 n=1 Tax=Elsinoe australis TaxID=40998 RepID=A0A4U7B2W9_9PEZI|nr:UDP-N-acetylglucosamine transporter yea4 [Elsinoe australis]
MFYAINMLNNWAFAFSISVPVHIILRSFGSVWTMGAGWIRGKRYSSLQVFSVALLTFGVIASAWADAESKGKNLSTSNPTSTSSFLSGLAILLTAQILSAYMGVYVQDTYADYSTTWQENLFWSHFLSLPLFLPLAPVLQRQYQSLASTQPLSLAFLSLAAFPTLGPREWLIKAAQATNTMPSGLFFLALNAATQIACISGVNLLSSKSSAVTVTIVLNVRKLVSFIFSTWLFGHHLGGRMMMGAALVFGSGALYGWETSWRIPRERKREAADGAVAGKKKRN